ncbi:MAG: thioredoxin [Candidatus Cloacimonadaceae bacterium]|jgi:thioredoxin 1|nr:thioredoxin [Candidatus Cloacimonadota bacterium]MDX9949015.1 thioredoxin [Candidatus Syntrophosphaera sp.]NLN85580.1 thioredoxin [Candidatus Cloacimonadota bacterium]
MLEITSQNFEAEVMQSDLPVLVDFWAPWCGPCKALGPTVDKIAKETEGKVKVAKCNIDLSPDIATRLSIMSIPTLMVFHQGQVVAQVIGLVQKDKIMDKLRPYL